MCAAWRNRGGASFAPSMYSDSFAVSATHHNAKRCPNWRGAFDSSSKRRANFDPLRILTSASTFWRAEQHRP